MKRLFPILFAAVVALAFVSCEPNDDDGDHHDEGDSYFNSVPVADAGGDRYVQMGQGVHFSPYASYDPDGDSLYYSWRLTARPSGDLTDYYTDGNEFDLYFAQEGLYMVLLIVSDDHGNADTDIVNVYVNGDSGGTPTVDPTTTTTSSTSTTTTTVSTTTTT